MKLRSVKGYKHLYNNRFFKCPTDEVRAFICLDNELTIFFQGCNEKFSQLYYTQLFPSNRLESYSSIAKEQSFVEEVSIKE